MRLPHVAWVRTTLITAALAAAPSAWSAEVGPRADDLRAAMATSNAALSLPSPAASNPMAIPLPPPPATAVSTPPARTHRLLGLQLDGGFPDFAAVSVLYRPWRWVRLSGGMLYDYAGYGVRAGVAVVPYFPIAPSLNLEVGRLFEANAAAAISKHAELPDDVRPLLERFGYTFANAQLGLEIGHHNWFVFFVRAGISRIWLTVHNTGAAAQAAAGDASTRVTASDTQVRLGVPSAKAGFMIFFW
jgi:hypothetical protein